MCVCFYKDRTEKKENVFWAEQPLFKRLRVVKQLCGNPRGSLPKTVKLIFTKSSKIPKDPKMSIILYVCFLLGGWFFVSYLGRQEGSLGRFRWKAFTQISEWREHIDDDDYDDDDNGIPVIALLGGMVIVMLLEMMMIKDPDSRYRAFTEPSQRRDHFYFITFPFLTNLANISRLTYKHVTQIPFKMRSRSVKFLTW